MIGRILCTGTGNKLTSPGASAQGYENGRKYPYAPPGKLHRYKAVEEEVVLVESDCDPRYGLVVIEDFLIKTIKPDISQAEWDQPVEFMSEFHTGMERAKDLAAQWAMYGGVLIQGELPTEEEIARGQTARAAYRDNRLTEVKTNQLLRRQGMKGIKAGYDPSDHAWSAEAGVELPGTLAELERTQANRTQEDEMVNCPMCDGLISPRARKCMHCQERFAKPVLEILTEPKEKEAPIEENSETASSSAAVS